MKKLSTIAVLTLSLCAGAGSYVAFAAQPMPMSFFVTSAGSGNGGNLGGIAGADARCQTLATAAGSMGKTWRAYLSTQARPGQPAVNAKDRIGTGPWYNAKGQVAAQNVADLHNNPGGGPGFKQLALNEKGQVINGAGDQPNQHDILTGSQADGTAYAEGADQTCNNWTSAAQGAARVGHHDRTGGGGTSWNSQHGSQGCSQQNLVGTGGAGYFYCFATN